MSGQNSTSRTEGNSRIERRWPAIHRVRSSIAAELEIKSEGVGGAFQAEVMAICDFLRGSARVDDAIRRPGVLAVCNPLVLLSEERKISQDDIALATHQGLCTLARHGLSSQSVSRLLLFPLVLTVLTICGMVFFSFYVLQPIEEMFAEFGINLPSITMGLLGLARIVRDNAILILLLTAGIPAVLYCLNLFGGHGRQPGQSWLDEKLARKRCVVSRFALHLSLLLEAGFSGEAAIEKASQSLNRRWLKRRVLRMRASRIGSGSFFGSRKFAMADTALLTEEGPAKIVLLRQVATWYRDSTSSISHWWVALICDLYYAFLVLFIFGAFLALFRPLFSTIGGLTGGGAPGGFF